MVRIAMLAVVFPLTVSARAPGCPDGYREMRDASQDACNAPSFPYGGDRSSETCCCGDGCCWDNCPNADRKDEAKTCIAGISGAMWHPSRTTRKWSDGSAPEESFILCVPTTTTTQTTSTTTTTLCNGADSGCKNIQQGDGDCDADSDCQSGLKCGANNCVGGQFDSTDDCCYQPLPCNGADSGCKNIQQGDGDCDADSDCQSGLKCGTNNCVGGQFDSTDDCCYRPADATLSLPELYDNRWMAFAVVASAAAMLAASGIAIARRQKDNTAYVSLLEEDGLVKVAGSQ